MGTSILDRVRKICLALPEAHETITWGTPHFRVGEKIFAGLGEENDAPTLGFKLDKELAALLVENDRRFRRAPYVGRHGWVSLDLSAVRDWEEVRDLVTQSYRLIAPKRLSRRVDG